jgi:hypothetical protein
MIILNLSVDATIHSLQPMRNLGELPKASTLPFTNFEMLIWPTYILFDPTEYDLEERLRFWATFRRPWVQQQATSLIEIGIEIET